MAWSKLYKVIVDGPIGYQTMNQLADNAADIRTQMLAEHGDVEYLPGIAKKGAPTVDYHRLGRHDLIEIPRTVAITALTFISTTQLGVELKWNGVGIPSVTKLAEGEYELPVLGLSTFWAKVTTQGGSTVTYLEPQVRPFYPSAANGSGAGLRVYTFGLVGGAFVPTDMPFAVALYGEP